MQSDKEPSTVGFQDLFGSLWSNRKFILLICSLGLVASVVVSFLIPEQFKSTAIIFPTRLNSVSKAILSEHAGGYDDILLYGEEMQAEQLLQILLSDRARAQMVEEFDLYNVYEVDRDEPHAYTSVADAFDANVRSKRTRYGSIEIEVLDGDPERAAAMANRMVDLVDEIKSDIQKERALKGLNIVESKLNESKLRVDILNDTLSKLRALGVNDYETQAERYHEQMGLAVVQNNQRAVKFFEEQFVVLSKYGGLYTTLQLELEDEVRNMGKLRIQYEKAKANYESDLPHKFVVDQARVADKKSYPVRWLIVVLGTGSAFLLSFFLLLASGRLKPN